jgi:hypothetical protein
VLLTIVKNRLKWKNQKIKKAVARHQQTKKQKKKRTVASRTQIVAKTTNVLVAAVAKIALVLNLVAN